MCVWAAVPWVWVLSLQEQACGVLGWPGMMSWGSWTSSVGETFLARIWDIGSASLSLRLKNLGLEVELIFWASALLVCSKSVSRAYLDVLTVSRDLAKNYQRTKPWLSLADFATWHNQHGCIWQRLFPSCCPFSVALSQTWGKGSDLWGMLPGHCPGE